MAGKSESTHKLPTVKQHKYRVSPKEERTIDGIVFHSKKEANRYKELLLLERANEIGDLIRQPKFSFDVAYSVRDSSLRVLQRTSYIGDFYYIRLADGAQVVEDVKGVITAEFKRKKKLFEKLYPEYTLVIT